MKKTLIALLTIVAMITVPVPVFAEMAECPNSDTGQHEWELLDTCSSTCTEYGWEEYYCMHCTEIKTVYTPKKTQHKWRLESSEPSTCCFEGFKDYYCEYCYERKTIDLPFKKHKWSKVSLIDHPDRDDVLIYGQECKNKDCGEVRYKPIKIKAKKKKRIWSKSYYKKLRKLTNGSIKWKSSKRKVATVSKSGVVKAKKKGTTFLRAKVTHKKYKKYPIYIKYKIVVK